MKLLLILAVYLCTVLSQDVNQMQDMPKYDARYDYLDVDAIFTNKRLVRNYVDCLINSNRCTPEGKQLKRLLPEALRTKCVRCTERQKRTAVKIIKRLKYEYPEEWAKLATRWDPTGDFTRYFEEFLAKEHFNSIPGSGSVVPLSAGPSPPAPPRPVVIPERRGPSAPMSPPLPLSPAANPMPPVLADPMPEPAAMPEPTFMPSTPRPVIVNRFGGDGELMLTSPSSGFGTMRPTMPSTMKITTMRPTMPAKPTPIMWSAGASNAIPTRFPLRPTTDIPPPYSTAITFIDQIGYKIIKTTELVTDLLRNTVRAVVG